MNKVIPLLLTVALSGCATQHVVPEPAPEPSVMAPPPEPRSEAADLAMFAERFRRAVATVIAGFFAAPYLEE